MQRFFLLAFLAHWFLVFTPTGVLMAGETHGPPQGVADPASSSELGVLWGRVRSAGSGEPALEASVKVAGTALETFTDYEGYYRLELAPGLYKLEIFYELHDAQTIDGVEVRAGDIEQLDISLTAQSGAIDEVVIEDSAASATLEGQLMRRQRASSAQDGVGRAEIAKTPDSNAAEAAQRVVGATIVGGRFVYVRGLGERYTNSLLHGAPLPSPDPNRASVPLDLFPALVIDSVNINKTFIPDMPADFAGGSVSIETRDIPDKPLLSVSLKGGYNDQSTLQTRPSYRGGGLDFLGIDDGTRALPGGWPMDHATNRSVVKPDGSVVSDQEITELGRALAQKSLVSSGETTPPNHGLSIVGGNGWRFGKEGRVGFIASANYDRSYERIVDGVERVIMLDMGRPYKRFDWKFNAGQDNVRWGLFGSTILQIDKNNSLRLMGLSMRNTTNRTQIFDGIDNGTDSVINNTRLNFVQQQMNLGQLRGDHLFEGLGRAELSYNGFVARATRDEPGTRDSVYYYNREGGTPYNVGEGSDSGRHFYSGQFEDTYGGLLNWTQPLSGELHKLKFGSLVMRKDRKFAARRFYYYRNNRTRVTCEDQGPTFPADCPDGHYTDENIGTAMGGTPFRLQEGTRATDAFQSELGVYAGYAQIDTEPVERLRVIAGARVEVTDQTARAVRQLSIDPPSDSEATLHDVDLLPAVSLIYSATEKFKLRLSYGRTLARPQVRELAPFAFNDYFGGFETLGNPLLQLTRIHNVDARVEFFPTLREVLALSVFAKTFSNPIESIFRSAGDGTNLTFVNTPGASLIGVEAEVRKNLGFLSPVLVPFSVVTNISLIASRVNLGEERTAGASQSYMTNQNRPMVNQSPVVFNLALDYQNDRGTSARVLFNVLGSRIIHAGTQGLPDAYEQPRPQLDFALSQKFFQGWEARLTLENLLNSPIKVTQGEDDSGPVVAREYTTGRVVSLGLKYEL